jgi:putative redox protein
MSQMQTETREAIVEAVSSVVNQIQVNPELGRVAFGAQSVLCEGLRADINIRNFALTSDEPESLGGTNEGPNPVELVLGAFAACQEIVIAAYAAVLDILTNPVPVTGTIQFTA